MKDILTEDLKNLGIINSSNIIYNPSYEQLFADETSYQLEGFEKVQETVNGAVNVMTGEYTGRSPKDKYIVKDAKTIETKIKKNFSIKSFSSTPIILANEKIG